MQPTPRIPVRCLRDRSVADHYDAVLTLELSVDEKCELVEFLKTL